MTVSGSTYGTSMLWAVALSCLFSYLLMEAYGRFYLVTGLTTLQGYSRLFPAGRFVAVFTLVGIVLGQWLALVGIMGLVSSAISQWAGIFFQTESWNPLLIAILATALLYVLVLIGRYSFFEKVLIVLVTTMSVSFTLTVLLVAPSAEQIITGIIPKSPDEPNASLIISPWSEPLSRHPPLWSGRFSWRLRAGR